MTIKKKIRIAVIDMNNGVPNQGLRSILNVLKMYKEDTGLDLSVDTFDLRQNEEIPDLSYDVYISSGGPGSPFDGQGMSWENSFFQLLDEIEAFNTGTTKLKKYMFLICHSFQMACRKYKLGNVTKRKSTAFGIFPISLTNEGLHDPVFRGLPNPFYAVDSRDWQVLSGDDDQFEQQHAEVAAIEKRRPHIDLERCIMSIRFSKEVLGTQFHPEADPIGMKVHLLDEVMSKKIITLHGEDKYLDMLGSLDDPDRLLITQKLILPNFLNEAIYQQIAV